MYKRLNKSSFNEFVKFVGLYCRIHVVEIAFLYTFFVCLLGWRQFFSFSPKPLSVIATKFFPESQNTTPLPKPFSPSLTFFLFSAFSIVFVYQYTVHRKNLCVNVIFGIRLAFEDERGEGVETEIPSRCASQWENDMEEENGANLVCLKQI